MKTTLTAISISCFLLALSGTLQAGAIARSTTGTSTETSTTSGTTASTGSCAGDSTAGKSTDGSGSTVTSGCTVTPPDIDDDGDGMTSTWEYTYGLDKYSALDKLLDMDNDFVSNYVEYLRQLLPNNPDTDGDLILDGDDPAPANASIGELSAEATWEGSFINDTTSPESGPK